MSDILTPVPMTETQSPIARWGLVCDSKEDEAFYLPILEHVISCLKEEDLLALDRLWGNQWHAGIVIGEDVNPGVLREVARFDVKTTQLRVDTQCFGVYTPVGVEGALAGGLAWACVAATEGVVFDPSDPDSVDTPAMRLVRKWGYDPAEIRFDLAAGAEV